MNLDNMTYEQRKNYLQDLEEKLFIKNEDYMNSLDEDPMGLNQNTKTLETEIHKLAIMIGKLKKLNAMEKMNEEKEESIEVLSVDEPTETLEDSITIKLPKQTKSEVNNVKIFFEGKSGLYKINYEKDNEKTTDMVMVDHNALDYNNKNKLYNKINKEYGEDVANSLDYNVYNLLGNFDKKNGTFMQTDYINGTLKDNITYDFRGFSKLKSEIVGKPIKEKIKNIAKKQKEKRNANIIRFDNKKVAAVFIAGGLLASISSFVSLKNKSAVNAFANSKQLINYEKGIENAEENNFEKGVKVDLEPVYTPEEKAGNEIYLNQDIYLDKDVSFYYDCYENGPSVKVEQLNCDFFRIPKVAVVIDGVFKEFYEAPENEIISEKDLKEMYQRQFPNSTIEFSALANGYTKDNPIPTYKAIGYSKTKNLKLDPQKLDMAKIY